VRRHLLALKAEALLGFHLVTRHRAPRLAALLGLGLVVAAAVAHPEGSGDRSVLLAGATLAVVGASRLLANGPALAAARMVAAAWWLVPVGRVLGVLSAVVPFVLGLCTLASGAPGATGVWPLMRITALYCTAVMACTMAITPTLGASASAALGLLAVWLGGGTPGDPLLLLAWTLIGIGVAAWQLSIPLGGRSSARPAP
jgi:hypothetical protein